jgi:hypothetical protein
MAYSTPRTWTASEVVTAAQLNQDVRDNVAFLANPPACRVYHNATQACADNAFTTLAFNSEQYDTAALHDTATNNSRITIPVAGIYLVTFYGTLELAAYNHAEANLRLNGASTIGVGDNMDNATTSFGKTVELATVYKFAAGDYIQIRVFQDNAANVARNLTVGPDGNAFTATWIGLG